MKLAEIQTPITNISGVGPALAKLFANLNIFTVADLLQFYPRDWEDRTKKIPLSEFSKHQKIHTAAVVIGHEWFGYGRMKTLKIRITDGTVEASLICFNRPFLEKSLPINSIISVNGHFTVKFNEIQSSAFEATRISSSLKDFSELSKISLSDSAVYPIYSLTAGLSQKQVRKTILKALSEYAHGIENELPDFLISKYDLLTKQAAILAIHKPEKLSDALAAKRTLIFEELYKFELAIVKRAKEHGKFLNKIKQKDFIPFNKDQASPRQKILLERLDFDLTADQKKVIQEMNIDIDTSYVPDTFTDQDTIAQAGSRLLQGDVGSGKTLTAFFAALRVIDWGGQVALLAPTEILAKQHAQNAANILETTGVKVAFLTGNLKGSSRKPLLKALKEGEIDIVIGTHALFSKQVIYKDLRLAIIDEQHRFGVIQRNQILDKGRTSIVQKNKKTAQPPNLLMMSATPIPQPLALTVYGDLDVSTIKTMPAGRKPIETHLTVEGHEQRVYEAVRQELKQGHQAYFVYPLIEQSDSLPSTENESDKEEQNNTQTVLKSATEQFEFLSQKVYPEFKCALVHSKVSEDEQSQILDAFRSGKVQVLIATTVVEVGVDVPNATCMVIEHAERFGLAALHQLRGRVGRGTQQSHCYLIYSKKLTELGKSRLKVMHESTDGFYIAEEDLKLRGPGEVTGIQQSGYLTLGIADPVRDRELLAIARKEAIASSS